MKYFFYILLITFLIIITFKQEKKIRKDQLCKEGLFFQMLFKKCTPRNFLYKEELQENI